MKEGCGFGSGWFGMDGSPGFSTMRALGEQWAQAVPAVAYGHKLEDLGILAAGSHQSNTGTAVLLRESPLGPSWRSLCLEKTPEEFRRGHLKIQTMHPFNPFGEPVR